MGTVTTMRRVLTQTQHGINVNTKTYYLIFSADDSSPPGITESWKAAEYWKSKGCIVEEYTRSFSPSPTERH